MYKKLTKKARGIVYLIGALLLAVSVIGYAAGNIGHSKADMGTTQVQAASNTSYEDSNKSITIKKVVTGFGKAQLTYYVADVKLSDITQLKEAFAKGTFAAGNEDLTSNIAKQNNALFAINGDYYGFRENGIIIRNGTLYRDVPIRTGCAFYKDGTMKIYDETKTTGEELIKNNVWMTLSFGPPLVENGEVVPGTLDYMVDAGNHGIQGVHPRTGVGMLEKNHFLFVVLDGRCPNYSAGLELDQFAQIFKDLGCKTAYNLDGGFSSIMYFKDGVVSNSAGRNLEREISDIIYISK